MRDSGIESWLHLVEKAWTPERVPGSTTGLWSELRNYLAHGTGWAQRQPMWIPAGQLERNWHPAFFTPECLELDVQLAKHSEATIALGELVRAVDSKSVGSTPGAKWLVRALGQRFQVLPSATAEQLRSHQELPARCLVVAAELAPGLRVKYWAEAEYGAQGVAPSGYFVLCPRGDEPIAWLQEELQGRLAQIQAGRLALGAGLPPTIGLEDLLSIRLSRRSDDEIRSSSLRVSGWMKLGASSTRAHPAHAPFLLTAASFEDRLRQLEQHLLEEAIVDADECFYVTATSGGRESFFSVREIGEERRTLSQPDKRQVRLQDDPEAEESWSRWYHEVGEEYDLQLFNVLEAGPALPTHLIANIAAPRAESRRPVQVPFRVLRFDDFRESVEKHRSSEGLDLEDAEKEVLALWDRVNGSGADRERVLAWARLSYRPVAAIKVRRKNEVVGAYLVVGRDQLVDPLRALSELELIGEHVLAALRQPEDIRDDAARRESLRRLSWVMHQLSGPLSRIDLVLDDVRALVRRRPDIGDELLPDEATARSVAENLRYPLENYRFTNRIDFLVEAVEELRRLRETVSKFKRAQGELRTEESDLRDLLHVVVDKLRQSARRVRVTSDLEEPCRVRVDKQVLFAALDEVVANSLRELTNRSPEEPSICIKLLRAGSKARIVIEDNGLPIGTDLPLDLFDEDVTTYAAEGQGSGLGLKVVHDTFRRHGGRCYLSENRDEQGVRRPGVSFVGLLPCVS